MLAACLLCAELGEMPENHAGTPSVVLRLVARSRGAHRILGRRIFTPFFSAALSQRETLGPRR